MEPRGHGSSQGEQAMQDMRKKGIHVVDGKNVQERGAERRAGLQVPGHSIIRV